MSSSVVTRASPHQAIARLYVHTVSDSQSLTIDQRPVCGTLLFGYAHPLADLFFPSSPDLCHMLHGDTIESLYTTQ